MTQPSTDSRVRALVAALFQVDEASLGPVVSPATLPAWDSMGHLNLVLELEQEFGIALAPERVEKMLDLAAVVAAVEDALSRR
jgi:acyl carrier protein